MDGRKKWNWTLALCVVLLAVNLWQIRQISDLRGQLGGAEASLSSRVEDVKLYMDSKLERADDRVLNWDVAPSVNMEKRCLEVKVSIILKEWRENAAMELAWAEENGGERGGSTPLSSDGKGTFTGVLSLPLDRDGMEFALLLVTEEDGAWRREALDRVYDTMELLPVQCDTQGRIQAEYLKDDFAVYGSGVRLYQGYYEDLPETESHVFRLRRNGEIAAEQAAELEEEWNRYICGKLSSKVEPGDRMALTFFCRDENGLGYEFLLAGWIAAGEQDIVSDSSMWEGWPKLTWN